MLLWTFASGRKNKAAGFFRIRPPATELDGGSVAPLIPLELAEGDSAGRGESIEIGPASRLTPFFALQTALQVSVFGPVPIAARKFFTVVGCAVDLALQENELPVTRFV